MVGEPGTEQGTAFRLLGGRRLLKYLGDLLRASPEPLVLPWPYVLVCTHTFTAGPPSLYYLHLY